MVFLPDLVNIFIAQTLEKMVKPLNLMDLGLWLVPDFSLETTHTMPSTTLTNHNDHFRLKTDRQVLYPQIVGSSHKCQIPPYKSA